MSVLANLIVRVSGDITELQRSMGQVGSVLGDAGRNISAAGTTLTRNLTLPLVGAGGAALAFATDFNAGMANVASLGADAQAAVAGWTPALQEMAVEVGKSTGDLTDGLYNVVSAFGAGDDSLGILETNARAAAAGLASTTDAINLTSAVTKGYGDTSLGAVQGVSDLALKTVQLGQTTFPELAASIGRVVPLAAQLGVAQDELFAVMATGTGVTGNAAEVSTQLRGVLQSLMAPTEDMANLFDVWGYSSGEALLESEGLAGAIDLIASYASEADIPLQKMIGSIEGQTLALALNSSLSESYTEKLGAMADAAGATDEAFAAQTEGVNAFGFQMKQLGVEFQTTAEQLGAALIPVMQELLSVAQPAIEWVRGMVGRFVEMDPAGQRIVIVIGALAAALGPVLMVLGPIVSGIGALVGILGALLSPIGLVIAAVAALAVAWQTNFLGIQDHVAAFVEWVTPYLSALVDWLSGIFTDVLAGIQALWATHGGTIMTIVTAVWDAIKLYIGGVLENIRLVFEAFQLLFEGDWRGLGEKVREIVVNIISTIAAVFGTLWTAIGPYLADLWTAIKQWFTETDFKQLGIDVINGIVSGLVEAGGAIKEFLIGLMGDALGAIKEMLGIESPSRVMALEVGRPMAEGVAHGWESALAAADFSASIAQQVQPVTLLQEAEVPTPTLAQPAAIAPAPTNDERIVVHVHPDQWQSALVRWGV